MGELIFWRAEGNAGATWDELRREMQKEQALRSDSGLKGKDCRWGRVHRNNMCFSRVQLHAIRTSSVACMWGGYVPEAVAANIGMY